MIHRGIPAILIVVESGVFIFAVLSMGPEMDHFQWLLVIALGYVAGIVVHFPVDG